MTVPDCAKTQRTPGQSPRSRLTKFFGLIFLSSFLFGACGTKLPVYPLSLGKSFRLSSHEGKIFETKDLYSKITLLYFGFTRCPSVCPENLKRIQKAQEFLGLKRAQLQILMISVDPEYDSPQLLKEYLSGYKMNVLGLWCQSEGLARISKQFGASFSAIAGEGAPEHFIDHSSHIFLLDKKAQLRYLFSREDSPQKIASIIRRL